MRKRLGLLCILTILMSIVVPVNVHADSTAISFAYTTAPAVYNYTGGVQQYNVPAGTDFVKVRLWGAAGSPRVYYDNSLEGTPSYGGYTEAVVDVRGLPTLYVYVGSHGLRSSSFNGGGAGAGAEIGSGSPGSYYYSGSGGGATDIRTISGNWNAKPSLDSRIMVSGGGAGCGSVYWSYKDGWSNGPSGASARDVFMDANAQTSVQGTGDAGTRGDGYEFRNTLGGGGGGWLGGIKGFPGTNYTGHSRVYEAVQAYNINSVTGRAEITPLVGSQAQVMKANYSLSLNGTPAAGVALERFPGDVTVEGNEVAGRALRYSLADRALTIHSNQQISLYGDSKELLVEDGNVALNRPVSATGAMNFQRSILSGSGGVLTANTANFTGCTFPSTAVSLQTVGDITFAGTINLSYGGLVCNGMTMLHTNIGVSQTDAGINNILLNGLYTNYMSSPSVPKSGGTIPLHLVLERLVEGSHVWERQSPSSVNLLESTALRDLGTITKTNIQYRVGYKRSDQAGYIIVQDNIVTGNSPGSITLDEVPPIISYFRVGSGASSVKTSTLPTQVIASDGRTTANNLKMQIRNGTKYYIYDTASKQYQLAGVNDWGPYIESAEGLSLEAGANHIVVFVKDESGNKSSAAVNILSQVGGTSSPLPDISKEELKIATTITTPLMSGEASTEIINGTATYVVSSNVISIIFDKAKLPGNIGSVKYSIAGDNYSEEMMLTEPVIVQLPPISGVHMIKLYFITTDGLPSAKATPLFIAYDKDSPLVTAVVPNGATITKKPSVPVELIVKDDISQVFKWSIDLSTWSDLPADGNVSIPVNTGKNNTKVYIKDSSGKIGFTVVKVWRTQ